MGQKTLNLIQAIGIIGGLIFTIHSTNEATIAAAKSNESSDAFQKYLVEKIDESALSKDPISVDVNMKEKE